MDCFLYASGQMRFTGSFIIFRKPQTIHTNSINNSTYKKQGSGILGDLVIELKEAFNYPSSGDLLVALNLGITWVEEPGFYYH